MKINERVFEYFTGEPFEVQELPSRKIELFYLNDYPVVLEEFANQGKFAIWSSVDGNNYRLGIEKDYYEKLRELYTKEVNEIWTNFWDEAQKAQSNYMTRVIVPGMVAVILIAIISYFTLGKVNATANNGVMIGVAVIYLFAILFFRKFTTAKINESHANSLDKIKKHLGENKFNDLLEEQRRFIDDYNQKLVEEADRLDAEFDAAEQNKEEDAAIEEEASVEEKSQEETK